jgi:lipopolysaccharide transport system ATP-binding protein
MSVVIKTENVSKQYRLGLIGTNTLKGDLQSWWYKVRGLPDPTLIIGQENSLKNGSLKSGFQNDLIWALKDINFEVKQGEVLGIIGKNGAGKSTLLKLLSRVTAPTTGSIKVKGRIASLLEVGTGFHPELTGRENIFLNGAILGMTKTEIRIKFDEIVDFAGLPKYIDTPVKRYSSGKIGRASCRERVSNFV